MQTPSPEPIGQKNEGLSFTHTHTLQLFPATGVNRGRKLSAAIESIKDSYVSTVNLSVVYDLCDASLSVKQRKVSLCVTYRRFFLC